MTGCKCRRCGEGKPHEPVDELRILKVLYSADGRIPRRLRRCHGYQNGCTCTECRAREDAQTQALPAEPLQPWEPRPARLAAA
ncbi:MAG TPA: hypothetical protein VK756_07675 [Solirubrobacteraceae bacterium]|jgi:hypothetical protein|nr:hypothetical protein [Solirubrobacteraceae bacterium]